MDSVVKQSSLLGWPKKSFPIPAEHTLFESSQYVSRIPVGTEGDYVVLGSTTTYYNANGTVKWSQNMEVSSYSCAPNFRTDYSGGTTAPAKYGNGIVIGDYIFAFCALRTNYNIIRVVRFSLIDGSYTVSDTNLEYVTFFTIQGSDLIVMGDGGTTTGSNQTYYTPRAYRVNIDTLATVSVSHYHHMIKRYLQTSTQYQPAVALFDGALLLNGSYLDTGTYNSHDACTVIFAMNADASLDNYAVSKNWVQTTHEFATDMFVGNIQQVGADLFIAGSFVGEAQHISSPAYNVKYYTRAELERWASDCIYKTTGIRFPLNEGV